MLYRGVDKETDAKNGGQLLPKGTQTEVVPLLDGKWKLDGTMICGPTLSNTARAQQIDSGLYGGCGISASRSQKIAVEFATGLGTEDGFIYVLDESKLTSMGIFAYEFIDPKEPHECEVTLIHADGKALPASIIVGKYAVTSDRIIGIENIMGSE